MSGILLPGDKGPDSSLVEVVNIKVDHKTPMVSCHKTYIPKKGDLVVGIIRNRYAEHYTVDIRASAEAFLDATAFNQATKKTKPNLNVGDVVYAAVTKDDPDYDFEITCDLPEDKKGWMQGSNYLGQLVGGMTTDVTLAYAADLLRDENVILEYMGEKEPYQVAVGQNGRVWLEAGSLEAMIRVKRALEAGENQRGVVQAAIVNALFSTAIDE